MIISNLELEVLLDLKANELNLDNLLGPCPFQGRLQGPISSPGKIIGSDRLGYEWSLAQSTFSLCLLFESCFPE